jgi:hypothetical protein
MSNNLTKTGDLARLGRIAHKLDIMRGHFWTPYMVFPPLGQALFLVYQAFSTTTYANA